MRSQCVQEVWVLLGVCGSMNTCAGCPWQVRTLSQRTVLQARQAIGAVARENLHESRCDGESELLQCHDQVASSVAVTFASISTPTERLER